MATLRNSTSVIVAAGASDSEPAGGHGHRRTGEPPVDQQRDADRGRDAGHRPGDDRLQVDVIAHLQHLGDLRRDDQPHHMSGEHRLDAEMEDGAGDAQQSRLVDLRGPRGPAELVVAVAPRAHDQHRQRDVGRDAPEQDVLNTWRSFAGWHGQGKLLQPNGFRRRSGFRQHLGARAVERSRSAASTFIAAAPRETFRRAPGHGPS